jgi:hypothetical protein
MTPEPRSWRGWLFEDVPFFERLGDTDQRRLIDIARVIMAEKQWVGCEGMELTERVRLCIAAQAALLLLRIEHDYYRSVREVLVYPTGYVAPQHHGPIVRETPVSGQAVFGGPIILSWDSASGGAMNPEDGHNVVFHEFAHALDLRDDYADGTPMLGSQTELDDWIAVMTEHYQQLVGKVQAGRRSVLDRYGATNPAEFFAVATEAFFEKPDTLRRKLPELYGVLQSFYNQDPARW